MNFIKGMVDGNKVYVKHLEFPNTQNLEGDVTVAVRPEDISLKPDNGLPGTIRQVMVLGHYAEVSFDTESGLIKAFLPRDSVKDLVPGQSAGLSFSKVLSYKTT
jgi:putative spermidine/putrescine transport system ATP-binding protein